MSWIRSSSVIETLIAISSMLQKPKDWRSWSLVNVTLWVKEDINWSNTLRGGGWWGESTWAGCCMFYGGGNMDWNCSGYNGVVLYFVVRQLWPWRRLLAFSNSVSWSADMTYFKTIFLDFPSNKNKVDCLCILSCSLLSVFECEILMVALGCLCIHVGGKVRDSDSGDIYLVGASAGES